MSSDTVTSADGTALAVFVRGPADAQPIVLCHGLGLTSASWGRVPALLEDAHRVIAYDLRGHGDSTRAADGDYGLFAHARDLAGVLGAKVRPGERPVVVGHSLGGGIILAHAHAADDHGMAGVVFAGSGGSAITLPGLPPARGPDWAASVLRTGWLGGLRLTSALLRRVRPIHSLADALIRRFAFEPHPPADAVRQIREHFAVSRPEVLAETTRASGSHDGTEWAPELAVPTVVVHGELDPQVPPDEVRRLVERLPQGRLCTVPGAGHMLPLTQPEVVAEHVRATARDAQAAAGVASHGAHCQERTGRRAARGAGGKDAGHVA